VIARVLEQKKRIKYFGSRPIAIFHLSTVLQLKTETGRQKLG